MEARNQPISAQIIKSNSASEVTAPPKKRATGLLSAVAVGPLKKRMIRTKNATECSSTPMNTLVLDEIAGMNSAEFVESELNLLPALPNGIGYQVSLMSNEAHLGLVEPPTVRPEVVPPSFAAASSLLALKTGLTPICNDKKFKEGRGNDTACFEPSLATFPTVSAAWIYPCSEEQNVWGCRLVQQVNDGNLVPRFTYPPPPKPVFMPKIKVGTPSPPSYRSYPSPPKPVFVPKIKVETPSPPSFKSKGNHAGEINIYPPPPKPVFAPKIKIETPSPPSYRSNGNRAGATNIHHLYDHKSAGKCTPSKDNIQNHRTVMKAVNFSTTSSHSRVMCSNLNQARVAMRTISEIKASPICFTRHVSLFSPIQINNRSSDEALSATIDGSKAV